MIGLSTSYPYYHFIPVAAYKSSPEVQTLPILNSSVYAVMSQTNLHLIGDSNVILYLPLVKSVKDDPFIQDSTMSKAVNAVQLQEVLSNPQKAHPVIVVAAMTNPITAHPFEEYSSMIKHCEKFFTEVKAWIEARRASTVGAFQKVCLCHLPYLTFQASAFNILQIYCIEVECVNDVN